MRKILFKMPVMMLLGIGPLFPQRGFNAGGSSSTATTVTNATGTISQLNYGNNGSVQGFLVGTNILLSFPGGITGGVAALGAVGNSVTYSGTAVTSSSGFESVRVTSFTNNTTHATYTAPTSTSASYGPVSGTVKQLNYQPGGGVDGFVFAASGSSTPVLVLVGPVSPSSTLASDLTVGATVSVTGTSRTSSVATASALTVVNASSLTIGSQTFVIHNGGGFGGPGPGRGGGF